MHVQIYTYAVYALRQRIANLEGLHYAIIHVHVPVSAQTTDEPDVHGRCSPTCLAEIQVMLV